MVTVALITPVYATLENQRVVFLKEALESLVNQSFAGWIDVVVDDGSTVDVKGIVNEFSDKRIVYLRREHEPSERRGPSNARNLGIDAVLHPERHSLDLPLDIQFFSFFDSDDLLTANSLESRLSAFSERIGVVYSNYSFFYNGRIIKQKAPVKKNDPKELHDALIFSPYCTTFQSSVWRRSVVELAEKGGLFDEDMAFAEDTDAELYLLEAANALGLEAAFSSSYCLFYRKHRWSITGLRDFHEMKHGKKLKDEKHVPYKDCLDYKIGLVYDTIRTNGILSIFFLLPFQFREAIRPIGYRFYGSFLSNESKGTSFQNLIESVKNGSVCSYDVKA